MYQYQIWNHKYNGRFYEIHLHKDFFDWVINLAWGSVRKKPLSKTLSFETFSDASTELKKQQGTCLL